MARGAKFPPKFYGKASLARERLRGVYLDGYRGEIVLSRAETVPSVIQFSHERCCRPRRGDYVAILSGDRGAGVTGSASPIKEEVPDHQGEVS